MAVPTYTPVTVQEINPIARSRELGIFSYATGPIDSGGIPRDSDGKQRIFKYLRVRGTPGDIVYLAFDGKIGLVPACAVGQWQPVAGIMVLASGVINGTTYNTTATDIWWGGGT